MAAYRTPHSAVQRAPPWFSGSRFSPFSLLVIWGHDCPQVLSQLNRTGWNAAFSPTTAGPSEAIVGDFYFRLVAYPTYQPSEPLLCSLPNLKTTSSPAFTSPVLRGCSCREGIVAVQDRILVATQLIHRVARNSCVLSRYIWSVRQEIRSQIWYKVSGSEILDRAHQQSMAH